MKKLQIERELKEKIMKLFEETYRQSEGHKPNYLYIETRSKRLQLVLQPSLFARVKKNAKKSGLSVNEFCHRVLDKATKGESEGRSVNDIVHTILDDALRGEQEAYIQELRQRLYLAEKVCYEANGYLKSKENPLGRIYLERLAEAIEKWDNGIPNKGAQYIVTKED